MSKITKITVEINYGDSVGNVINALEDVMNQYPNAVLDDINAGCELIFKTEKTDG